MGSSMLATLSLTAAHVAWACGWLPGITGFALAADLDDKQQSIEVRLGQIETRLNASLEILMAQEICRLYRLRDTADEGQLISQLSRSLEEKQQAYATISGSRYPLSECAPQG